MTRFILKCACRGVRPKSVELANEHKREQLVSKLMGQRSVLRAIVAPNGYGKSILAAQYGDIVFSYKEVFWISCNSPCFLRDLDKGDIASQIIQISEQPRLVIFDDIGEFDEDRQKKISAIIDELLEYGCETIATLTPLSTGFLTYQKDALIIDSEDLLVSEHDEQNKFRSLDNESNSLDNIFKIPGLYWGNDNYLIKILSEFLDKCSTNGILKAVFYIYITQNGKLEDLKSVITETEYNLLLDINKNHIFLGINECKNSYCVPKINVQTILDIYSKKLDVLLNLFSCKSLNSLSIILSKKLLASSNFDRYFELIEVFGNNSTKIKCLQKYNEESIKNVSFVSACNLYNSIETSASKHTAIDAYQSWRLALLGKNKEAIKMAYRILDNDEADIEIKIFSTLIFLCFGSSKEKLKALKLSNILCKVYEESMETLNKDNNKLSNLITLSMSVLEVYKCIYMCTEDVFQVWTTMVDSHIDDTHIMVAAWILLSIEDIALIKEKASSINDLLNTVSRYINSKPHSINSFNFYHYSFIKAYLDTVDSLLKIDSSLKLKLENFWLDCFNKYDVRIKAQKDIYKTKEVKICIEDCYGTKDKTNSIIKKEGILKAAKNYSRIRSIANIESINYPKININLFGGLSVWMGKRQLDPKLFSRQKLKLILCFLAIENGREINKQKLSEMVWPGLESKSQLNSMNTHWSILHKIFTLPDGSCPYLTRTQSSYNINKVLVSSDVQELDDICAQLTIGHLDSESWYDLFSKKDYLINGDLLPSESENTEILKLRKSYKDKIVNALITASERLLEAREIHQALWFAHKAVIRDSSREDTYLLLMKCQMAAGQRTPAMDTYYACKRYLDDKLGLEPSKRLNLMYKNLVSSTA